MQKLTKATLVSSLALAEIGRHREKGQINARNAWLPSCFCISRFKAIDLQPLNMIE